MKTLARMNNVTHIVLTREPDEIRQTWPLVAGSIAVEPLASTPYGEFWQKLLQKTSSAEFSIHASLHENQTELNIVFDNPLDTEALKISTDAIAAIINKRMGWGQEVVAQTEHDFVITEPAPEQSQPLPTPGPARFVFDGKLVQDQHIAAIALQVEKISADVEFLYEKTDAMVEGHKKLNDKFDGVTAAHRTLLKEQAGQIEHILKLGSQHEEWFTRVVTEKELEKYLSKFVQIDAFNDISTSVTSHDEGFEVFGERISALESHNLAQLQTLAKLTSRVAELEKFADRASWLKDEYVTDAVRESHIPIIVQKFGEYPDLRDKLIEALNAERWETIHWSPEPDGGMKGFLGEVKMFSIKQHVRGEDNWHIKYVNQFFMPPMSDTGAGATFEEVDMRCRKHLQDARENATELNNALATLREDKQPAPTGDVDVGVEQGWQTVEAADGCGLCYLLCTIRHERRK